MPKTNKSKYGQFFTPDYLADTMVDTIVKRLGCSYVLCPDSFLKLKVFDPSVGEGAMLMAWCRKVTGLIYSSRYGRRDSLVGAIICDHWDREGTVLEAAENPLWDDIRDCELYQPLLVQYVDEDEKDEEWISGWDVKKVLKRPAIGDSSITWEYREIYSQVAGQCYGFDIDQECVDATKRNLSDASGLSIEDFDNNIACDDFLLSSQTVLFDVIIMNPPYLGGGKISSVLGKNYRDRLKMEMESYHGRADLCAYFIQRSHLWIKQRGMVSIVATKTISEGKTRLIGLKTLVDRGFTIYNATTKVPWPGDANVTVHIVHLETEKKGPLALDTSL
jgi:hypothetical protein